MITWHYMTKNDYNNMDASLRTPDRLFFIKDTNEIFCGDEFFKDYVLVYNTDTPTTKLIGRLYTHAYTLDSKIFDGSSFIDVISPVIETKVTEYIDSAEVGTVEYDTSSNVILITFIDGTTDIIKMNDLTMDITYGKSTGEFVIDFISAKLLNHNELINLNDFIDDISYASTDGLLSIKFRNKNSIDLNIGTYIEDSTDDIIGFSISGNEFIAECALASNEDNMIMEDKDLFIVCKNNYTVVTEETTNEIITGNSVFITENAIAGIISVLQESYSEYRFNIGAGKEGEIIVADENGYPIASGKKIGGSTISETEPDKLIATEEAITKFVKDNTIPVERIVHYTELAGNLEGASDTDVLSEKAFVESIKWNIL